MSNLLKKVAVSVSTVATVAAMGLMPMAAKAAAPGEVYKTGDGTVWFITSDMQKRPFTSAGAFLSYGFLSFSQVKDADASVTALPTGAFIAPADGKIFCATETKGSDVKGECSLITGGQKAAFTSAAVFTGQGFSFSRAISGDSSFLSKTSNIDSASAGHLPGVLVNNSGTVQMVVSGGLWGIPSVDVFNSWGYSFSDVVPANAADKALAQVGVIPARQAGQLVPSGTTTPTPSGAYTASVASDSPAASTLVAGQATANLANFTVSGNGTVTSLKFKRTGVSADATLSNVYLFEGNTRITDAASVSSGFITFAGLNWPVSGARNVSVRSDIATGTSGQTVGVQLVAVNGTDLIVMPSGAIHTIATATLATVAVGVPTSTTTTDPGNDVNVWQSDFSVGTRDVVLNRIALRQIESINSADIRNFRLYVDGVQVSAVGNLDANGYVTFGGFSKTLTTGSRQIKVLADVIGGSSRNIKMSLRNKADLGLVDSQYQVNVTATGTFPAQPASATAVSSGSITVTKAANSPSGSVTKDASNVVLGRWTMTAYGEAIKVETLNFAIDTNNTDQDYTLRNGKVMVNGTQVGSTTGLVADGAASSAASFTTNFMVNPGTPVTVELVSDIYDEEDTGAELVNGSTIQATMLTGSSNGTRQVSLGTVNVPSSNIAANVVTVAVGSLSMAKTGTYGNQTFVSPTSAFKIASYQIAGNSTEDVNVHTIAADIAVAGGPAITDVTDVYFKINGTTQTSVKPTVTATGNSWSVSFVVPKNGTVSLDMYANLSAAFGTADTVAATTTVTGTTANSGTSVNTGAVAGQTITAGAGAISMAFENSSGIAARLLTDGQNDVTTAAYRVSTLNDSQTLQDFTVTVTSATTVNTVKLYADGALIASKPGATSVSFNDLGIPVPANSSKLIEIKLDIGAVTNTTGLATVTTSITAATAAPGSTGVEAAVTPSGTGNTMYVFASVPVIAQAALTNGGDGQLTNGVVTIAKFTMNANGGPIQWKAMNLALSKSTAITGSAVQLFRDGSLVATTAETIAAGTTDTVNIVTTNPESVSGSVTYEVRATIANAAAGNFLTASFSAAESAQESAAYASVAGSNFVWSDVVGDADEVHSVTSDDWHNDYLVVTSPISWTVDWNN
ncbi:hypothetical protein IPM19_00645 [bacterium]|nr:MAG: hypothetical protein IPM19_00645 [bacterium]